MGPGAGVPRDEQECTVPLGTARVWAWPGRERPAGRQGLLDTALTGSSLLQTKMPICPKVYLIILGNLQCPQDYGWHGSSWGGQSPEWPLAGPSRGHWEDLSRLCIRSPVQGCWSRKTPAGQGRTCPHRPVVDSAQGQAVTQHPSLLELVSTAQTYGDSPGQRWGPLGSLGNATMLQGPPRSKTGVPEPPMPDLRGPLGSDSGKPFSESYLGDLPGNWAPTRSTSPLRAEFQGVACWAGLVAVCTAKRYRIPEVGGSGDRPVPAPPIPGWVARLLGGHSGRSCSKSESRLLHPVVCR